ncbi:unnamed protein product [Lymnaea stagnalis]|uniref:Uncharacterized protein n=1 Tax=Lymnaea stagnalis TaxID=6523 RepID=A0AAV2HI65_LYMST
MKKAKQTALLDKAHLWTVRTMMGITVAGSILLTYQIFSYFSNVRPTRLEEKRKVKEIEIALEQQEKEAELLRRQKEAEQVLRY